MIKTTTHEYVRTDEHGVMRIGDSRVMLDSVVAAFDQGSSPETIQQQYPTLSLEEVYGAVTYYLAHRKRVQQYLRSQDALWEKWRKRAAKQKSPALERLRSLDKPGAA